MRSEKFESDFQLIGTRIVEYKLHNDFVSIDGTEKKEYRLSHSIEDPAEEGDVKLGTMRLSLQLTLKREQKKLKLDLVTEGCFAAPREMDDGAFKEMLGVNGTAALYSLSRAFVLSTTSQALLEGKVMLPMMNFIAYDAQEEAQAQK